MRHRYPPGPIHLTKTHLPTLPIYYSVGNFKVDYMETLKSRGLDIYAAYGNTTTDIRAYGAFGIPKACPFTHVALCLGRRLPFSPGSVTGSCI